MWLSILSLPDLSNFLCHIPHVVTIRSSHRSKPLHLALDRFRKWAAPLPVAWPLRRVTIPPVDGWCTWGGRDFGTVVSPWFLCSKQLACEDAGQTAHFWWWPRHWVNPTSFRWQFLAAIWGVLMKDGANVTTDDGLASFWCTKKSPFKSQVPSGELTFCYGKWPFIVDFPINSMVIFHSKMLVHQRVNHGFLNGPVFHSDVKWPEGNSPLPGYPGYPGSPKLIILPKRLRIIIQSQ